MDGKGLRSIFHWKYSGVFIPLLWCGMLGMLGLASNIENSKPLFILAYILSFTGFLWSLGFWLTCDFLHGKNPNFWTRLRKKRAIKRDWIVFQFWKFSVSIFITAIFLMSCFLIGWIDEQKELSSLQGWLKPANDPIPPHPCENLLKDDIVIFLGKVISITNKFPHIVLKVKGEQRIVLDRKMDGLIAVSIDVLSQDGKVIASIEKGKFMVNRNNVFLKIERKDRSSLRVIDQFKTEVLNIRYFNPQALWIDAVLHYPGVAPIIINGSRFGPLQGNVCFYHCGVDIVID
jgi:hypothetical protein